jgi:peptide subunit release factor 1 (eRF1)
LDVLVPSSAEVDTTTKTDLLWGILEELPHFVVTVLQRDKATIYVARQGTTEQQIQLATDVSSQPTEGTWSRMKFQRHMDFHFGEHLKNVVDQISRIVRDGKFTLALGGTDETVERLRKMLPSAMADRVIGQFPVDHKHDTQQEILQRAQTLWDAQEQSQEERLVDQVIDAAHSQMQGVLGVELTLSALTEEKVRTLLFADGLSIDGSVCTQCEYFAASAFKACPLCGASAEQTEISNRAVEKAILTGAEAERVTSENARNRLLAEGGIGALLRY